MAISWLSIKLDGNCKILLAKQQEQIEASADYPGGFDVLAVESIGNVMKNCAFTR